MNEWMIFVRYKIYFYDIFKYQDLTGVKRANAILVIYVWQGESVRARVCVCVFVVKVNVLRIIFRIYIEHIRIFLLTTTFCISERYWWAFFVYPKLHFSGYEFAIQRARNKQLRHVFFRSLMSPNNNNNHQKYKTYTYSIPTFKSRAAICIKFFNSMLHPPIRGVGRNQGLIFYLDYFQSTSVCEL